MVMVSAIKQISLSPTFKATSNDSRIDFHKNHDIKPEEVTHLDDKVLIGRAPGEPMYTNGLSEYKYNKETLARDLEYLQIHENVGVIFDLRSPIYEGADCIESERYACKNKKIKYINIPLDSAIAPTKKELDEFFNGIESTAKKVYIHCHAGKDRTGIMSGCYLAKKYGLSPEEIFKKVFDDRHINRLNYMYGHPQECEKLFNILKSLAKK